MLMRRGQTDKAVNRGRAHAVITGREGGREGLRSLQLLQINHRNVLLQQPGPLIYVAFQFSASKLASYSVA